MTASPGAVTEGRRSVPLRFDRVRGTVLAGLEEVVAAMVSPDPTVAVEAGRVLRRNRNRVTGRVVWPRVGPVLLKAHRTRSPWQAVVSWVRPSRARREWRAARFLEAAGVPVPQPYAYGVSRRFGMERFSFFAARFLPDVRDLRVALAAQPPRKAHRLIERVARLIRTMHDRRFDHRDLNGDNVLAGPGPGDRCDLHIADLHRCRMGRPVSEARRVQALARWLASLGSAAGPGARRRTVAAYAEDRTEAARRALQKRVERATRAFLRRRVRSEAGRCLEETHGFTHDVPLGRGARRRDVPPERIVGALEAHDATAPGDPRLLKIGRKSKVTAQDGIVVKEALPHGVLGTWKQRLAPGRLSAGYRNAHLLDVLGVPTARPLAFLWLRDRAVTLYEDLTDRERLDHHVRRLYHRPGSPEARRLRTAVATWAATLHRRGVYHGDLKAVNVLVGPSVAGPRLFLVDTDRLRWYDRPVDFGRRMRNLAQLAASIPVRVTRAERLRWCRTYARRLPEDHGEREVTDALAALIAKKTRVVEEPLE